MKRILFTVLILFSCEKYEPSTYIEVMDETPDTTTWDSDYVDGGTINNNVTTFTNKLISTKWVITHVQTDFVLQTPNDTLTFIDNNTYKINNGANKSYQLSLIPNTNILELRLDYPFPIGSGIWVTQISNTFVEDGLINNAKFINLFNENDNNRLVTMKKV